MKAIELGASEILNREQLKRIVGGGGSGGSGTKHSCLTNADCAIGTICCHATDGSGNYTCVAPAPSGGCPTSGVSGCYTMCTSNDGFNAYCIYDAYVLHKCKCLYTNVQC